MNIFEGDLVSGVQKIVIVCARFNSLVTERLLEGALSTLKRHGISDDRVSVVWVPGAFEISATVSFLLKQKATDLSGIICLGAVIKGDTPHFDYVCSQAAAGIHQLGVQYALPIAFGVLTTDTTDQAMQRAGLKAGNKGEEATLALLEMCSLFKKLSKRDI